MTEGALSARRTQSSSVKEPVCAMSEPAGQTITAAIRSAAFTGRSDRHHSGLHKNKSPYQSVGAIIPRGRRRLKVNSITRAAIKYRHKGLIHQYNRLEGFIGSAGLSKFRPLLYRQAAACGSNRNALAYVQRAVVNGMRNCSANRRVLLYSYPGIQATRSNDTGELQNRCADVSQVRSREDHADAAD